VLPDLQRHPARRADRLAHRAQVRAAAHVVRLNAVVLPVAHDDLPLVPQHAKGDLELAGRRTAPHDPSRRLVALPVDRLERRDRVARDDEHRAMRHLDRVRRVGELSADGADALVEAGGLLREESRLALVQQRRRLRRVHRAVLRGAVLPRCCEALGRSPRNEAVADGAGPRSINAAPLPGGRHAPINSRCAHSPVGACGLGFAREPAFTSGFELEVRQ
jgi:hypothetical protein